MSWLVTKLLEVFMNEIAAGFAVMFLGWTDSLLKLDTAAIADVFTTPGGIDLYGALYHNVIVPAAMTLLVMNLVYQLYRSFFSREDAAEEPVWMVFRSMAAALLIVCIQPLLELVSGVFQGLMDMVNTTAAAALSGTGSDTASLADTASDQISGSGFAQALVGELTGPLALLVEFLFLVILLIELIRLVIAYVEKLVIYQFITYLFPLSFAAMPARSTQEITKNYLRMYLSALINLFISSMFVYLFLIAFTAAVTWDSTETKPVITNVIQFAICISIVQFSRQLDRYLERLGLIGAGMGGGAQTLKALMAGVTGLATAGRQVIKGMPFTGGGKGENPLSPVSGFLGAAGMPGAKGAGKMNAAENSKAGAETGQASADAVSEKGAVAGSRLADMMEDGAVIADEAAKEKATEAFDASNMGQVRHANATNAFAGATGKTLLVSGDGTMCEAQAGVDEEGNPRWEYPHGEGEEAVPLSETDMEALNSDGMIGFHGIEAENLPMDDNDTGTNRMIAAYQDEDGTTSAVTDNGQMLSIMPDPGGGYTVEDPGSGKTYASLSDAKRATGAGSMSILSSAPSLGGYASAFDGYDSHSVIGSRDGHLVMAAHRTGGGADAVDIISGAHVTRAYALKHKDACVMLNSQEGPRYMELSNAGPASDYGDAYYAAAQFSDGHWSNKYDRVRGLDSRGHAA